MKDEEVEEILGDIQEIDIFLNYMGRGLLVSMRGLVEIIKYQEEGEESEIARKALERTISLIREVDPLGVDLSDFEDFIE